MYKKQNIFLSLKNKYIKENYFHLDNKKSPFFSILNHNYTTKSFIDSILKDDILEAKNFISKYYINNIDMDKIKEFFNEKYIYKKSNKVSFYEYTYEKTNAFIIMDTNLKFKGIINFYMIDEPDNFSKWKIYKITKEVIY